MANYSSNLELAQEISARIGNEPIPFESVSGLCMEIYQELGGDMDDFDDVYSILLEILPLAQSAGVGIIDDTVTTYNKTWSSSKISSEFSGKQDTLTAGTGITIENNTISAAITVGFGVEVVQELPITGETNTIYFVPSESEESENNTYDEYIYVNSTWEFIGNAALDLTGYATETYVTQALTGKQNVLTAGTNISISGDTISSTAIDDSVTSNTKTWSSSKIDGLVSNLTGFDVEVVQELPASGDTHTIYFLPSTQVQGDYDEYMWVNDSWDKIGTTTIDLTNYYTKTQTDTLLAGKQGTLTAGTNIDITNNAISAIGYRFNTTTGAFAEGDRNINDSGTNRVTSSATGLMSHAEGTNCTASGKFSHAEGNQTIARATHSHAEGAATNVTAGGTNGHAEGRGTTVNGYASHAEGDNCETGGNYSSNTKSAGTRTGNGDYAHAEGNATIAKGIASHSEGRLTLANGNNSHAEGASTIANGSNTHAEGRYTQTLNSSEHAQGSYNKSHSATASFDGNAGNTLHSIGIGTANDARKNAVEVMQNGDIYIKGIGNYDGNNLSGSTLQTVINGKQNTLIAGTGIAINGNTISATISFDIQVVQSLPLTGATNTIYFVPISGGVNPDVYDEYMYISNAWEKIGNTTVDLSNYYTKTETDNLLANKQGVLTAGTGISISGNTISVSVNSLLPDSGFNYATKYIDDDDGIEKQNVATGNYSNFAEGSKTTATSTYGGNHAEGYSTSATGDYGSHSEGAFTEATAEGAHAEGFNSIASGEGSHAEGFGIYGTAFNTAAGQGSHAEGVCTFTQNYAEHAEGCGNVSHTDSAELHASSGKTLSSIGMDTTGAQSRKNAREIMANGDCYIYGIGGYDGVHIKGEVTGTTVYTLQDVITNLSSYIGDLEWELKKIKPLAPNQIRYTTNDDTAFETYGALAVDESEYSNGTGIITFNSDLTTTGDNNFSAFNQDNITSIELPKSDSLYRIDVGCFENQTHLKQFTIPISITEIGDNAFYQCSSLEILKYEGTMDMWSNMSLGSDWYNNTLLTQVICIDGVITL